jgi:rhodanese-related sulfurtransferase
VHQQRRAQHISKTVRAGATLFDEDDSSVATLDGGDDVEGERKEEYFREWPNKQFIAETLEQFPEAAVADVEQARVLFSEGGYTYLDVRPALENEDIGKVKGSVNIPIVNSTRKYDPEQKKKVTNKTPNDKFIEQVEKRFPKKDTKLLVGCSNGTQYSFDALEQLDEAGYDHIVGLKGGYYAWFSVFDNKLGRRRNGEYAENYTGAGDSCGIHSSGAGFDRVDKADRWVPPEY